MVVFRKVGLGKVVPFMGYVGACPDYTVGDSRLPEQDPLQGYKREGFVTLLGIGTSRPEALTVVDILKK